MPKSPMVDKFASRAPKAFGDEGEPEEAPHGTGMGGDAGPPDMPGKPPMPGAPGGDDESQAVDDMGDILGIGPEDRADFGNALHAYVSSCVAKALAESGEPDGDEMPMPPGEDEEAPPPQ